ncbi:MAG: hypothetical protein ABSG46_07050, partial [Candidatus Binataceae bacterium]
MPRSVLALIALFPLWAIACAGRQPPRLPPFEAHAASLAITRGIHMIAFAELPDGFVPAAGVAPLWLEQGLEIGVIGMANGNSTILGLSGPGLTHGQVLAADFGPAALNGRIVEAAPNADGSLLATAVADASTPRIEIVVRGMAFGDYGQTITSFDGSYDAVTLAWLGHKILAIGLRPAPPPDATETPLDSEATLPSNGIYLADTSSPGPLLHLDGVNCPVSPLSVAPNERFAVSAGADGVPAALFDLKAHACRSLGAATPIKPLSWAPDSSSFLFAAPGPGGAIGTFRYILASGAISTVAISSTAAAIASEGTIVAIGNRELTWQQAARNAAMAKVEVALIDPPTGDIKLNSLGFETTPAMMALSPMAYSTASDCGAIDAKLPGPTGPQRELINYSARSHSAFVLGMGPADNPIAMSWSPNGLVLAMVT